MITPVENRLISKSLENAQKKVEGFHFDQKREVVKYDDVMNRHRKATYAMRKEILKSEDISKRIKIFVEGEAEAISKSPLLLTDKLESVVTEVFPFDSKELDHLFTVPANKFGSVLLSEESKLYSSREAKFTPEIMRKLERDIYLQVFDNLWMQHLENMDHLREGIHWMSVGQRDPLVEYRRQGQRLFEEMQLTLRHEVVKSLFNAQPISMEDLQRPAETELTLAARQSVSNIDQISSNDLEFRDSDFKVQASTQVKKQVPTETKVRKKAHKAERQRKAKARKRK